MTRGRTHLSLAIPLIAAAGLAIVAGCGAPSPATTFEQARVKFAAGQWAECIMVCTEAISQRPDDVRAYVLRGRAFCRVGQFEPAITDFSIAIKLNPQNPEYYYLRADARKEQGDLELADLDNKAGQLLDPAYQRAYLYAPPDDSQKLTPTAVELSKTLRESEREPSDDPLEILSRPPRKSAARPGADSHAADLLTADDLIEGDPAQIGATCAGPVVQDVYGLPVATGLAPGGGLTLPSSSEAGSAANRGALAARRLGAPRKTLRADADRRPSGPPDDDPRLAQQPGSTQQPQQPNPGHQRGSSENPGNTGQEFGPPPRALHPFGAATMRATGVPSDQFDEEAALEEEASGGEFRGGGAGRRSGGRGQFESGEFGPGSGFGTGRTGFSGVLDPYGGYTRSSRPIGGMQASPYGGAASPYGGAQRGTGANRGGGPGPGGAPGLNPYGPLPTAPVPNIEPPGLRYDQ